MKNNTCMQMNVVRIMKVASTVQDRSIAVNVSRSVGMTYRYF
jgi:hypothetical protein